MTNLGTIKDIEAAVEKLTQQEFEDFSQWFDQYNRPQPIDRQLKEDLEAGKLDDRIRRAVADHNAGRTQLL